MSTSLLGLRRLARQTSAGQGPWMPLADISPMRSRRTHEQRPRLLADEGLTPERLDRLHSLIGRVLSVRTPEETALPIMAEVAAWRNAERAGCRCRGSSWTDRSPSPSCLSGDGDTRTWSMVR
ncbi:XdhC family protein [Streptomyces sp. NPDC046859]|uniref:XdhC family protein n=1 Tax=Streptomyces sp. NPDC046859 TaxID=3155734 RepID=UPI0033F5694F